MSNCVQKEEPRSSLAVCSFLHTKVRSSDFNKKNAIMPSSGDKHKRVYIYNVATFLLTLQSVILACPLGFLYPSVNWEVCLEKVSKSASLSDCSSPKLDTGKRRNNMVVLPDPDTWGRCRYLFA